MYARVGAVFQPRGRVGGVFAGGVWGGEGVAGVGTGEDEVRYLKRIRIPGPVQSENINTKICIPFTRLTFREGLSDFNKNVKPAGLLGMFPA